MQDAIQAGVDATTAPATYWQCPATSLEEALAAALGGDDVAIDVKVNQARWIAECPDCCGAQETSRSDRRFMCNYCANAKAGGLWRPVRWPADVDEITAVLDARPDESVMNWNPDETVEDLVAENEAHGVGV